MLKNILNLNGVQKLNKTDQKALNGGGSRMPITCNTDLDCEQSGSFCPGRVRCTSFGICFGVSNNGAC